MSSRRGSVCRGRGRNLWRRKRLRVLPARKNRPEAALLVPVCRLKVSCRGSREACQKFIRRVGTCPAVRRKGHLRRKKLGLSEGGCGHWPGHEVLLPLRARALVARLQLILWSRGLLQLLRGAGRSLFTPGGSVIRSPAPKTWDEQGGLVAAGHGHGVLPLRARPSTPNSCSRSLVEMGGYLRYPPLTRHGVTTRSGRTFPPGGLSGLRCR